MKLMPCFTPVLGGFLAIAFTFSQNAKAQEISAAAYVVIDHNSGHVLDSFNPTKKLQIASLTKIATATVVLDWSHASSQNLDQLATVPTSAQALNSQPGAGLTPGDRVTLRDLLYAALLQSDNAAAETLACHVGQALGSDPAQLPSVAFIAQMNALARKLEMPNTRFLNAHGLDTLERKLPYSSAGDVAKVTAYAMSNPAFRFLASQNERRIVLHKADGSTAEYRLRNTNELLGKDAIDGVKTGTTQRAGQCVVVSSARSPEVKQNGETFFVTPRRLEVVLLGSENRFAEAALLLKRGWTQFDQWVAEGRPETPKGSPGQASVSAPFTNPNR